jgi:effector-binding domain-containing protein
MTSKLLKLGIASCLGLAAVGAPAQNRRLPSIAPAVVSQAAQPYVAVEYQTSMDKLGAVIPMGVRMTYLWLSANHVRPSGPPFVRYKLIDMPRNLDVEIGFPCAGAKNSGKVHRGVLPAGKYVTCVVNGPYDRLASATAALLAWAKEKHLKLDMRPTSKGTAWGGRAEFYLNDPATVKDPAKYATKIVLRLAGN